MVRNCLKTLDSGFCRNDGKWYFLTFYEIIKSEPDTEIGQKGHLWMDTI
jgi:hypothetical protein